MSNPFSRFYTTDITILNYEKDDYTGETKKDVLDNIKADVQPYSGGKANEEYGVNIECQMRMFCDNNPNVDCKNSVMIYDKIYDIVYVAKWKTGLEVMLKRSEP